MSVLGHLLLSGEDGYTISRSVRLRSSASAYFNRTNSSSPTNSIKWTWSGWVKRGSLGAQQNLVGATNSGSDDTYFNFNSSDKIVLGSYTGAGTDYGITTAAVFRDPSAWYHVVGVLDTANATSADRAIIYVNGVRQTVTNAASGMWPQNATNNKINTASQVVNIGRRSLGDSYLDGYLTEINFIDGQALTPSSFGETDAVTGVWKPKRYTGTYGTNGFYINFSDNSSNTATTIGKDYSGNGNNWTPNNISVTSGATYDSMLDVPTPYADGGNGRGNYAVINPLAAGADATISNANLSIAYGTSATVSTTLGSFGMTSGQWYWENTVTASSLAACTAYVGLVNQSNPTGAGSYPGATSRGWSYYSNLGYFYNNGSAIQTGLASFGTNDVIGVAFDADAGTLKFYKNNTQIGTTITGIPSDTYYAAWSDGSTANTFTIAANFGQRPFTYTPPSGFVALNTQNLPEPTIKKGNQYFDVRTWSGDGATPKAVVTDLGFTPDLIWAKARSNTYDHMLFDSVRGAGSTKDLSSNTTGAEGTSGATYGYVSSIDSAGFTVTKGSGATNVLNQSGQTFAAWNWKASGTTSSNTSGSITSTVSVNATAGFSVVAYNSGASGDKTVGHGLGVAPSMIITKSRSSASYNWSIYHSSVATTVKKYLTFTTDALQDNGSNIWGSAFPTSSVFGITSGNGVVASTDCIAYCFSAVRGYSAFGSYTGNNSSDGPFVYTGFRPRWILFKDTTNSATNWVLQDTSRFTYNVATGALLANTSASEYSTGYDVDILSNGFKIRRSGGDTNASGATIVYAAFAENPFKLSLAR